MIEPPSQENPHPYRAHYDLVLRNRGGIASTDKEPLCPTCGQPARTPISRACVKLREQMRKVKESMDAFIEEMREARRQQARERENPPLGKRVNQHWGKHRKRRPPWQRDRAFLKDGPHPWR